MVRFLVFILLGYLGFKLVKKIGRLFIPPTPTPPRREEVRGDELIQDPVCKTFIPRREALTARSNGKDYFFCSEGCRKRFLQEPQKFASERRSE